MARFRTALGAGGWVSTLAKLARSSADNRMIALSSIALFAASCAALTTKSEMLGARLHQQRGLERTRFD
jgi:hypothetical protein